MINKQQQVTTYELALHCCPNCYDNHYHNSLTDMEDTPPSLPTKTHLAIIGAGSHALTFVCKTCASVWKDGKQVGESGG